MSVSADTQSHSSPTSYHNLSGPRGAEGLGFLGDGNPIKLCKADLLSFHRGGGQDLDADLPVYLGVLMTGHATGQVHLPAQQAGMETSGLSVLTHQRHPHRHNERRRLARDHKVQSITR